MSQLVATINGKQVYSDKAVASIVNNRITFADGSWCDVVTGQVVNKGQGYINIGSPEGGGGAKVTEGPKTYAVHNLEVRDVVADLEVCVHQIGSVEVTITGPANEVKSIRTNLQGDTLVVEGEDNGVGAGGITIISGGGSSVTRVSRVSGASVVVGGGTFFGRGSGTIISGRNVVISGGGENQTKITVKVPKGATVNLAGVSGNCTVGDTEGALTVNAKDGNVSAGCVANATLSIQGGDDINVREVNGMLAMSIMGSGDIRVDSGKVSTLAVNVMGSGDASFNGQAETATLTIMGSGDIRVSRVTNRPSKNIMGSGDIRVGNW